MAPSLFGTTQILRLLINYVKIEAAKTKRNSRNANDLYLFNDIWLDKSEKLKKSLNASLCSALCLWMLLIIKKNIQSKIMRLEFIYLLFEFPCHIYPLKTFFLKFGACTLNEWISKSKWVQYNSFTRFYRVCDWKRLFSVCNVWNWIHTKSSLRVFVIKQISESIFGLSSLSSSYCSLFLDIGRSINTLHSSLFLFKLQYFLLITE